MGRAAVPSPNSSKNSKDVKLSDKETLAIVEDMRQKRVESVKNFFTGMAKAVTTDLPGFLMDFTDKLVGDTASFGEKDRSAQLFEKMTGIKTESGSGGVDEFLGAMIDPVSSSQALIVSAVRAGKNVDLAKKLTKAGMSPATVFDQTGVYLEGTKAKTGISDAAAIVNSDSIDNKFRALGKVLQHDELYALYPELKHVSVTATEPGTGAMWSKKYNTIGVDATASPEQLRQMLFHEVQHSIQDVEKFKGGGSPEQFRILDPSIKYDKAYKLYTELPGEKEATFAEYTSQMTKLQLEAEIKKLLQAGGTPASPQKLAADLERFTNP